MIDPADMELSEWANATVFVIGAYATAPPLADDDWRSWGETLTQEPSLQRLGAPSPYHFDDWREWGRGLAHALQGIN